MGRIVVTEFVSLDGVMEDPGGSENFKYGGWTFQIDRGEEGNKFKLDEALEAEALLREHGCWRRVAGFQRRRFRAYLAEGELLKVTGAGGIPRPERERQNPCSPWDTE